MILWKSKEELETREPASLWLCEKFRWALQTSWCCIEFVQQYKFKDREEWYSSHTSTYGISITKHFCLGSEHIYYDGPHCFFSLGFVHFFWGGNPKTGWCEKCHPTNE